MKTALTAFLLTGFLLVACDRKTEQTHSTSSVAVKDKVPLCGTPTHDKAWYLSSEKAPLLNGLDGIHFPITTQSKQAQQYFDQGLMLAYGFNHAEAARSFYEATRLDSTCAACFWGFSYVLGPNYNGGMEDDNYSRAYQAVQKARQLAPNASPKEQALINALTKRYPAHPVANRSPYDQAYADAMEQVYQQFPDDADIGALYAESIMDLHPWDLWQKNGQPQPWTPAIVTSLERLLRKYPQHVGMHHFYIHAVEASRQPERGLASARFLEKRVAGAGHLEHMPSHIYIRTGHYHESTVANLRAVEADRHYLKQLHAQGAYPLAYYPHNIHFIAATATLEGNRKMAMKAAREMADQTDRKIMREPGWGTLQHYYTQPYYVAIKFGRWDDILQMKNDAPDLAYPTAIWHYARGMAYLAKQDSQRSKAELSHLTKLANDTTLKALTIWNINTSYDLLQIARRVLAGEIAAQAKNYAQSIALLGEAVALEDRLNYNEPPDWLFSVRHHLGAVLLEAKRWQQAEQVYTEDLKTYPRNGWSLYGLYQAQQGQGNSNGAKATKAQFDEAWKWADTQLVSSRFL
ncbi:tetratricopeptide repeat protein [Larkinella bovis]|uniref:Tetratricopeptide repeat protein n=1 Tax=Larkinella bovis TaxID=683041 RepID=A0ABW0IEV7_9BACT